MQVFFPAETTDISSMFAAQHEKFVVFLKYSSNLFFFGAFFVIQLETSDSVPVSMSYIPRLQVFFSKRA